MICMTFVAKEKRGIGQHCNFLQRRVLAFMDVLLARATPLLHIYTRIALESKQNPGLRRRERGSLDHKTDDLKVNHFSSEHLYVETRYHTACSMSSKGICRSH